MSSIVAAIPRPDRALAAVLSVVAFLPSMTLVVAPARALFDFEALPSLALAVPPVASLGVLLPIDVLKPI